ncbi:hypothetical protein Tco_0721980 [Tanacetum coccineum]
MIYGQLFKVLISVDKLPPSLERFASTLENIKGDEPLLISSHLAIEELPYRMQIKTSQGATMVSDPAFYMEA